MPRLWVNGFGVGPRCWQVLKSHRWLWCAVKFVNLWAIFSKNIYCNELVGSSFCVCVCVLCLWAALDLRKNWPWSLCCFLLSKWTLWILRIRIDLGGWRVSRDKPEGHQGCSQRTILGSNSMLSPRAASQQFICSLQPMQCAVTGTFPPDSACCLEVQIN